MSDNGTLPLHIHPASLHDSRLSSVTKPVSSPPASANAFEMSSPVITALKAELSTAQATLPDLKNSLISHEESVKVAHAHLQTTLEGFRNRRKEDDVERQELKTKTKRSRRDRLKRREERRRSDCGQ